MSKVANLSFSFPFFGRIVDSLILSTAGVAVVNNQYDDELPGVPSHIAPFFSTIEPGNDDLLYFDDGSKFVAQWSRPFPNYQFVFQMILTPEGGLRFLYKNLNREILDQLSRPPIIGIQDGFVSNYSDGVVEAHLYPSYLMDIEDLVAERDENRRGRRRHDTFAMFSISSPNFRCRFKSREECSVGCHLNEEIGSCTYEMEEKRPKRDYHRDCPNTCLPEDEDEEEVCGTDGKTYKSKCLFHVASCRSNYQLQISANGPCDHNDDGIIDDDDESDEDDEDERIEDHSEERKSCLKPCPKHLDFVCGSDGTTYDNVCLLEVITCQRGDTALTWKKGSCSHKKAEEKCLRPCPRHYDPLCCSDGKTYANQCLLDYAICLKGEEISVLSKGVCPEVKEGFDYDDDDKDEDGDTSCSEIECGDEWEPVCGSNNVTYTNECFWERASCFDTSIKMNYPRSCEGGPRGYISEMTHKRVMRSYRSAEIAVVILTVLIICLIITNYYYRRWNVEKTSSSSSLGDDPVSTIPVEMNDMDRPNFRYNRLSEYDE